MKVLELVIAFLLIMSVGIVSHAQTKHAHKAAIKKLVVTKVVFTQEDLKNSPDIIADGDVQKALVGRSLNDKTNSLDSDLLGLDAE
jgi:hypothetical protein